MGLLDFAFSQGDRMKRHLVGLLADPIGSMQQTAGLLSDFRRQDQELNATAFANPQNPLQVTSKAALGQLGERMLAGPLSFAPAGMILYHGSNAPAAVRQVKPSGGVFDGLFASPDKQSAASHGQSLYRMTVPDKAILSQRALDYDIDPAAVNAALSKAAHFVHPDDMEIAYKAIVEDASHKIDSDELMRIMRSDSAGEASWEAQRIRGQLAKNLGFRAVEMSDEHGISYLIPTAEKLRPFNQAAKDLWRQKK